MVSISGIVGALGRGLELLLIESCTEEIKDAMALLRRRGYKSHARPGVPDHVPQKDLDLALVILPTFYAYKPFFL